MIYEFPCFSEPPFPPTPTNRPVAWWRHQMEKFSALLAICAGKSTVIVEFPAQRPVTQNLMFSLSAMIKWLSKQPWWWWIEASSYPVWRHRNNNYLWCSGHFGRDIQIEYRGMIWFITFDHGVPYIPVNTTYHLLCCKKTSFHQKWWYMNYH